LISNIIKLSFRKVNNETFNLTTFNTSLKYKDDKFTIEENGAPLVNAGADQTIFQCALAEVCWNASVSDPDGNLVS